MKSQEIRCPKGPAIIYLYYCSGYISTILSATILSQLTIIPRDLPPIGVVQYTLMTCTSLFFSIVLFSKKYNNWLFIAVSSLLLPCIIGLFSDITPYVISDIIFYLLLMVFTYIMVKKPDTPVREKAVKYRFIIPVYQAVYLLISLIDVFIKICEGLTEHGDGQISAGAEKLSIIYLVITALSTAIPIFCYASLANWLANPYKKDKKKRVKKTV